MSPGLALGAAAVFGAGLLLSVLLRGAPAADRRDLGTLAAVVALGLPLLAMLPALPVAHPAVAVQAVAEAVPGVALQELAGGASGSPGSAPLPVALLVWGAGVGLALLRLASGHVAARRLRRTALPADPAWAAVADAAGDLPIRAHTELSTPVLVGLLRPAVLVPAHVDWDAPRRRRALQHEAAHAAARDNLCLLVLQLVRAVHWFDPLAWVLVRRVGVDMERAADAAVVAAGACPADCAADLVALARARKTPAGVALGGPPVAQRVRALLAAGAVRPVGPGLRAGLVLGLLGLAVGVGAPVEEAAPASAVVHAEDAAVQATVEGAVAGLVQRWSPDAAAIVVVDTRTGAVVARAEHGAADRAWGSGSVVKPFVAVAALQRGVAPADLGPLLEVSDNPGFVRLAERVGVAPLAASLRAQGLSAAGGARPEDLALGQFPTTTTELAQAYARLGETAEGRQVQALLVGVVEGERGTGRAAAVPGRRVAGKTGSALLGTTEDAPVLASFVGLVPAEAPRYAVAVQVAGPTPRGWGGTVAAPAFAEVAAALP